MLVALGLFLASVVFLLVLSLVVWFTQRKVEVRAIAERNVLVTGCDTGFGNMLARSLDARGVRVFAGCLTKDGAESLTERTSSRLTTFIIDITKTESVEEALDFVTKSLNGEGLWGLVNNAGVMPVFAPIEWTSLDEYELTCKVNLFGTISVTKAFLPLVRKTQGRIVNVCSVTSNCGYPGISSYVISKAALKMFSICLSYIAAASAPIHAFLGSLLPLPLTIFFPSHWLLFNITIVETMEVANLGSLFHRRELLNAGVTVHTIEPGGFQTNLTSKERIQKVFRDAYKRADPEVKDVYGGHIARYIYKGMEVMKKYISTESQRVPENMMHALFAKYPKQSYLVGSDAKLFFQFIRTLPSWVVDYILGWPQPYGPILPQLME